MASATGSCVRSFGQTTRCIQLLVAAGLGSHAHSGGTLLDHLLGTAALLEEWDCEEYVVCAGLTHALFAPPFRGLLTQTERVRLLHQLGPKAVRAAIIFSHRSHTALSPLEERNYPQFALEWQDLQVQANLIAANFLDQLNRLGEAAIPTRWPRHIDVYVCAKGRAQLDKALA